MLDEILKQALSLGMSGLLFVMWWHERQERLHGVLALRDADGLSQRLAEAGDRVLDVVRSNTEALMALREELRLHRAWETEALRRLSEQIANLEAES